MGLLGAARRHGGQQRAATLIKACRDARRFGGSLLMGGWFKPFPLSSVDSLVS